MNGFFWQVYRYARFTVDGVVYRKLRKQYTTYGGIVNAQNITTGDKLFFLDQTPVIMLESQDNIYRKPVISELHLRNR